LPPGIDVLPGLPAAGTKIPVIVQQHDEARGRKRIRKSRNAVMPRAGVTMGHRDRGARLIALFRQIEPSAELYAAINCKFDVFTCRHISNLTRQRWRQISAVFKCPQVARSKHRVMLRAWQPDYRRPFLEIRLSSPAALHRTCLARFSPPSLDQAW